MSFSGCSFVHNNIDYSSQYGLYLAQITTTANNEIGGNLTRKTFKPNNSPLTFIQSFDYSEENNLTFDVEFVSEKKLDDEIQNILFDLTNRTDFNKLYIEKESYENSYFNCYFEKAETFYGGGQEGWGIYAIKATMVCDSSFLWQNMSSYTYTKAQLLTTVTHNNRSFVRGYTTPKVTITVGTLGGNISLINQSNGEPASTFTNVLPNDVIVMTNLPKIISANLTTDIYDKSNKKFLKLINGNNKLTITGDIVQIKIEYQNAKAVV